MQLTEQTLIKPTHPDWQQLDQLSALSKNLYNAALYDIRQHYFQNKKHKHYNQVINDFTTNNNPDYISLPRKVSQQTIRLVGQNFTSFFGSLKSTKVNHSVSIPKYLKKEGRAVVNFPKDSLSRKVRQASLDLFEITLCTRDLNIKIKTRVSKPDMVRLVPRGRNYVIEVIHTVIEPPVSKDNERYASIDLGVNNLMAVFYNTGDKPELWNGRAVKSINQFFNKKKARLQSELVKISKGGDDGKKKKQVQFSSKQLERLSLKRKNKLKWELHNISTRLVNQLASRNITKLVVGYNSEWKQDINLGKRNNQNFVSIPYTQLLQYLEYKCKLAGIEFITTEESYSSKCSALDKEKLKEHKVYLGKRVKRGLFRTQTGFLISADVNGAINILRKVVPDDLVFSKGIEGVVGHPVLVQAN